jgi:hypothetical protein
MALTSLPRFLALVAGCALSGACATTRYTQSRIEALPSEVKGHPGAGGSVEIEGLKLRIETLDRTPRQHEIPPLSLLFVFEPRELGYSFDPGQVVVRGADGSEWRARGGGYRPVYPKASFQLAFDVAVGPGAEVDLVLSGLARGPKRLEPVTLRLARQPGRSIDRMYWLEVLGYVLSAPLAGAAAYDVAPRVKARTPSAALDSAARSAPVAAPPRPRR